MSLVSLTYSEFEGQARRWNLERIEFGSTNLVVGKNATGKSRVLSVIANLCLILAGVQTKVLGSGTYEVELDLVDGSYRYQLTCKDYSVANEALFVNGAPVLERDANGRGRIWYEAEREYLTFQIDPKQFALPSKRDPLQHPFVSILCEWAAGTLLCHFGSDLGKSQLMQVGTIDGPAQLGIPISGQPTSVILAYLDGFHRWGEQFDDAITSDMCRLGFPTSRVDAGVIDPTHLMPEIRQSLLALHVTDSELNIQIPQIFMSQGMYRALALTIYLNRAEFLGSRSTLLVDDIGEGLDYERSVLLVELAMEHARRSGVQIIMTSNDRFVMNKVPLDSWIILERRKSTVRAHTAKTSPKAFEDFKFMGLSNFDFFTAGKYH